MPDGHAVTGLFEGKLHRFRLFSPVEKSLVDRIMKYTTVPSGGVYVIHHPPVDHEGRDFYREFRERNPGMRAYIGYTAFETDSIPESWVASCNAMDEIWVPSFFNAETFERAGVSEEKLHVIPHSFDPKVYDPNSTKPLEIRHKKGFNFLSIFEWTYRKGWDVLMRAYLEEFKPDEDVNLIIRTYQGGGVIGENVLPVIEQLRNYIKKLGYHPENIPDIEFIDEMVPSDMMPSLYMAADAFVLPSRGEGWGIPFTESMLMEVPVITTRWSGHLQFMNSRNSYLIDVDEIVPVDEKQVNDNPLYAGQKWAEPSVAHTRQLMRYAFQNRDENRKKGKIAREHIINNFSLNNAAVKIAARLSALDENVRKRKSSIAGSTAIRNLAGKKTDKLRILYQARSNVFSLPGGDTDVMIRLKRLIEDNGITVDFSSDHNVDLKGYSLVHIFNFDTSFAINAALQGKPYVVTPMYEDLNRYYQKSMEAVNIFSNYTDYDNTEYMNVNLMSLQDSYDKRYPPPEYTFIASHAQALFTSGASEKDRIKNDFPHAGNIELAMLGFDRPEVSNSVSPDLFISEYGVKDFVLCVGRLESRKNQLMLLYALKEENVPLVLINSTTVQPEYEELCRRIIRKGKTIITGRVSKEMLYSAFMAAKVHALPSWYELPGLVSLEAAEAGCNAVCSDWGTVRDYLGDYAYYCHPGSPESIKKEVLRALNDPFKTEQKELLGRFRWERTAENVCGIYERVLNNCRSSKGISALKSYAESARKELLFHQYRGKAFTQLQKAPGETLKIVSKLSKYRPDDAMLHFISGAAYLLLMNYEQAEDYLRKSLAIQPYYEIKSYLYLSLALMKQDKFSEAASVLKNGLMRHPFLPDKSKRLVYEYLVRSYNGMDDIQKAEEMKKEIRSLNRYSERIKTEGAGVASK